MHWYWFGFTRLHILSISLLISTPLTVAFAWLFFRCFERPFMTLPAAVKIPAKRRYASVDGERAREAA
jgi:peptidoglycan/LPS O-acetylase OafA/YrhL